jgi:hypothetical protein
VDDEIDGDIDSLPTAWHAETAHARPAEPLADLPGVVTDRLANPLSSLPLSDLCGPSTRVTLVYGGASSGDTQSALLHGVLRELESANVPPEQVTLLTAQGVIQRRPSGDYGSRISVIQHDPDDLRELDDLGNYEGVPLATNFRAAEADLLIAITVTSLDSGTEDAISASAVAMGMAGYATQRELSTTRFFDDRIEITRSGERSLFERVVREGARRAGLVFAITALEDAAGGALDVQAGAPNAVDDAVAEAITMLREALVSASAYDVILAEPRATEAFGVYDASLAAINIGLARNPVLMRGGVLILPIGRAGIATVNGRAFVDALADASEPELVIQQLQGRSLAKGEARAYLLAQVMQRYHVIAAGQQEQLARNLHFVPAANVREAAELAESLSGRKPQALIVKDALRTVPSFGGPLTSARSLDDLLDDLLLDLPEFN